MKIVTISREFGSGGRELGKRLAEILAYDYYDKEIIESIAANKGVDEGYVARTLENNAWQSVAVSFRQSVVGFSINAAQIDLLVEQKRVIENIANAGKNCIIVGRNAGTQLAKHKPLKIFVCASMQTKLKRCIERAPKGENLSPKQMERKIRQIDKERAHTCEIITESSWGHRDAYHLIINTSDWDIAALASATAEFVKRWHEGK